jgi:hypothetical protein
LLKRRGGQSQAPQDFVAHLFDQGFYLGGGHKTAGS